MVFRGQAAAMLCGALRVPRRRFAQGTSSALRPGARQGGTATRVFSTPKRCRAMPRAAPQRVANA
eukprot:11156250-Lingulodinium_polyedra.AAC.1